MPIKITQADGHSHSIDSRFVIMLKFDDPNRITPMLFVDGVIDEIRAPRELKLIGDIVNSLIDEAKTHVD